jgi:flagellar hook protein FlgE
MSLFGTMNTAISGMNAQSNRLSAVGDNIANADTTGYKKAEVKFSTFLLPSGNGQYNSGSVQSNISYDIATQGSLKATSSSTDIAVTGRGFFVVQDANGTEFLTRAGSFTVEESGYLINAAGFTLMGTPVTKNGTTALINGLTGLVPINLEGYVPKASPTDKITLGANLDSRSSVVAAANLPSTNTAGAVFTKKVSITAYDSLGKEVVYDVYYTKKTDPVAASVGPPATPAVGAVWDVAIYRQDTATNGGFPYTAGSVTGNTMTLTFDPSTGKVASTPSNISVTDNKSIPSQTIEFDFSAFTQLATDYAAAKQEVNGQKAAKLVNAKIATDGTVYAVYSDNSTVAVFRIPLADVASPNGLEPLPGNVYRQSSESGVVFTGFPGEGAFGKTIANTLEASNVDMAHELTEMIQSQRNYTANSKVFQTGSDLMDILVNLKR